jgi:hypothetical protein
MPYQVYTVALPEHPEAVMFMQGIVARKLAGLFWVDIGFHGSTIEGARVAVTVGLWRRNVAWPRLLPAAPLGHRRRVARLLHPLRNEPVRSC